MKNVVEPKPNHHAPRLNSRRPFLITFSGIDGAGKTTQIERLTAYLEEQGLDVLKLIFWDDVAIWPNMRAGVGGRAANFWNSVQKADPAGGETFTPRNHKHIRNWYLNVARMGLYFLDVVRLHWVLADARIRNSDVVIFDRYIYDQIANVDSQSMLSRIYRRILLWLAPRPDVGLILDASPAAAFARKPEYPLDFVNRNRADFLRLRELDSRLIAIPEDSVENVSTAIIAHVLEAFLSRSGLMGVSLPQGKAEEDSGKVRSPATESL
jgi:thymidylate kinase